MGLLNDDERATTGTKIAVRSKTEDPRYFQANDLLKQIDKLRAERTNLLKQADQYRERLDTLEAQFHRIVLELEPTEICTTNKPKSPTDKKAESVKAIQQALASKLADSPGFEEQLMKILESMK